MRNKLIIITIIVSTLVLALLIYLKFVSHLSSLEDYVDAISNFDNAELEHNSSLKLPKKYQHLASDGMIIVAKSANNIRCFVFRKRIGKGQNFSGYLVFEKSRTERELKMISGNQTISVLVPFQLDKKVYEDQIEIGIRETQNPRVFEAWFAED